jgi:flavodoxin
MKTLVIYYSLGGSCSFIAEEIHKVLGADTLRLELQDDKKREGFAKFFWGGRMILAAAKPPLKPYTVTPDPYDLIIIGTPVWAGSPAPAFRTFFSDVKITNKKVAFFCCCGGGKGKTFDKLKAFLPGNTFAGEIEFIAPTRGNPREAADKLKAWLDAMA